jgi:hypothetical protein
MEIKLKGGVIKCARGRAPLDQLIDINSVLNVFYFLVVPFRSVPLAWLKYWR